MFPVVFFSEIYPHKRQNVAYNETQFLLILKFKIFLLTLMIILSINISLR